MEKIDGSEDAEKGIAFFEHFVKTSYGNGSSKTSNQVLPISRGYREEIKPKEVSSKLEFELRNPWLEQNAPSDTFLPGPYPLENNFGGISKTFDAMEDSDSSDDHKNGETMGNKFQHLVESSSEDGEEQADATAAKDPIEETKRGRRVFHGVRKKWIQFKAIFCKA